MPPVNPFFHRGPIRDRTYFVGRERLTARALAFLAAGQSVALVGPRRIGKTSFLFHLMHSTLHAAPQSQVASLRCCYLDCESWGRLHADQLYGRLVAAMRQGLASGNSGPAALDPVPPESFATLEVLARQAAAQGDQIVLMLDEFDALAANPQLDNDFFASLRALAMEHRLAYVTVSTKPLLELTYARVRVRSSPFFNFFALLPIGLFHPAESHALLARLSQHGGIPFVDSFIALLITLAGDHPFFLQMLADYAFDQLVAGAAQTTALATALGHGPFRAEAADHWGAFWADLERNDQRLLALFPLLAANEPVRVRRLEAAGLVTRSATGVPVLFSQAFQAFVGEQPINGVLQAPPLTLDPALRAALLRGQPLALPPQQFDLLAYLVAQQPNVVTQNVLAEAIWQRSDPSSLESLRTALRQLREALGDDRDCIRNRRSQGYQFVPLDASVLSSGEPPVI